MIAKWPYKSPYAEAAARLHEAIDMAVIQAAVVNLAASMRDVATVNMTPDHVSNTHATNIRDDLATLIGESDRP
jgi:hypothetical protein